MNLRVGWETRISDLAELASSAAGFEGEIVWDAFDAGLADEARFDVSKGIRLTGFEAAVPMEEGIHRSVVWWRQAS